MIEAVPRTVTFPVIRAEDAVNDPERVKELVVKTATSLFNTVIATALPVIWFIPFGFLLVYFIY